MSRLSILTVILNYRTAEMTLKSCAAAFEEMRVLGGEIVIVDNDSGDGSFEQLTAAVSERGWDSDGKVRVLQSGRNGGFGAGMNFGMAAALSNGDAPDCYYLLNSDAWPDPGAVAVLVDFLQAHPETGLVGSGVRGVDDEPHRTAFRFPSMAGEFERGAKLGVISRMLRGSIVAMPIPEQSTEVEWTAGVSLMIRREVIEQTGGFDETFFLYYEETDLCRRAANLGWQTYYLPDSRVVHVGSATTGRKGWARTPRYLLDSRLHYFTKHHGRMYTTLATMLLLLGGGLWYLRRLLSHTPQANPDYYFRDLALHAIASPFARSQQRDDSSNSPVREQR